MSDLIRDPLGRLRLLSTHSLNGVTHYECEFDFIDVRGELTTARAKVLAPDEIDAQVPLQYHAGYEVPDAGAAFVAKSAPAIIVNPYTPTPESLWPGENPLGRSINLDVALLHIARSLPVVDDMYVTITGGSAGGYAAMMLAAETFPLRGVVQQVAPLNWGYNAAYVTHCDGVEGVDLGGVSTLALWGRALLGDDTSAPVWFAHSPLAHVREVTAPVHAVYTTADMLVPVDQVGRAYTRETPEGLFDPSFTADPLELPCGELGAITLTDVLTDVEWHVMALPEGVERLDPARVGEQTYVPLDLPAGERQWTVCVVDEGSQEPGIAHLKYAVNIPRTKFLERISAAPPTGAQATEAKLAVLAARRDGREWIDSPIRHLDLPEAEAADVERSMRALRTLEAADG